MIHIIMIIIIMIKMSTKEDDRGPAQHGRFGVDGQHGHAFDSCIFCWVGSQGGVDDHDHDDDHDDVHNDDHDDYLDESGATMMTLMQQDLEERPLTSLTMHFVFCHL